MVAQLNVRIIIIPFLLTLKINPKTQDRPIERDVPLKLVVSAAVGIILV